MPSLTKKMIKGKPYYYLRECQRVEGKPKIIWTMYLGSSETIRDRVLNPEPHEVEIFEFGASAAAFDIASTLDIVSIIDRHVRKRTNAGLSVGQYLLLAALYRHKVHKPLTKSYVRYICRPYLRSETFAGGTPEMTAIGISDMLSLNTRNLLLIERKTFIRFYPNPNESDQRKIFCFLTQRHEGTQFPVETQVKKE